METWHRIEGPFGREFLAFVIIAELWRPEVARRGNFVSNFCGVFLKATPLTLLLVHGLRPKYASASPPIFGSHRSRSEPNQMLLLVTFNTKSHWQISAACVHVALSKILTFGSRRQTSFQLFTDICLSESFIIGEIKAALKLKTGS